MNTQELFERWDGLSDEVREHLLSVISTRGRNKGYILASAPKGVRGAAWQAVVSHLAASRVSFSSVFWMADEEKQVFHDVDDAIGPLFRHAINATEPQFRWNLWAHRYDGEKVLEIVGEAKLLREVAA